MIAAYCRVSSPKRNGKSRQDTRSQRGRISGYADAHGLGRLKWYDDHARRSGWLSAISKPSLIDACPIAHCNDIQVEFNYNRTNLHRLWDSGLIRFNGEPWTRAGSSLRSDRKWDWAKPLHYELHENDVTLVCVNQGLTFDRSAMSVFMLQVFAALAELESSIKSERIKAGLAVTTKRLGRPRDETKRLRIRKLRSKGLTISRIADKMGMSKAGIYYLSATSK